MKALVSGGAGFVGSHIVDCLVSQCHDVVVLDDFSSGSLFNLEQSMGSSDKLDVIKSDIRDNEIVKKALKDVTVIFHEAAIVNVRQSMSEPELTYQVNVGGTQNLLRCAVDRGVERFIFASSSAVYGDRAILPVTEDTKPSPISPYGWSKLEAERLCLETQKLTGLKTTILRYFNVYGPRSPFMGQYSSVINKFAERLLTRESPVIYGDGKQTRDFIFVEDIVSANVLAASKRNAVGKIFNVGSGKYITIEELLLLESRLILGDNVPMRLEYQPANPGDILHSYADISLIKHELGFQPRFSLEDGLRKYIFWLSKSQLINRPRLS